MMTSKTPDFSKVYSLANEILVATKSIETFPFSMKAVIKEFSDAQVCSYSKAIKKYHVPITDFGSDSAHLEEYCGANIIFYNDKENKARLRFDLAHEFGHLMLGHKMNLSKDDPLYSVQEIETNCFAAQLLMPEQLLRECGNRGYIMSAAYIMQSFGVSNMASEKRRKTLAKTNYEWRNRSEKMYDDIIIERNKTFLDAIAPVNFKDNSNYFWEDEYERQRERNSWFSMRGR